jgi:FAD/FMN-containing dehydrogenase
MVVKIPDALYLSNTCSSPTSRYGSTMSTTPKPKRNVSEEDIKALRDLLSNTSAKILTPSDEGYALSIERWSRAAEKPAGVSIVPTTAAEAGIALQYVNDNSIDVAVKGGGHSTAGASSTNGGLLIDMRSGMHGATVDTDKQRLHVQGGAVWGDVDAAAWQHDLATMGGTVADTGVGGLDGNFTRTSSISVR